MLKKKSTRSFKSWQSGSASAARPSPASAFARATRLESPSLSAVSWAICWRNDWFSSRRLRCNWRWITRVVAAPAMTRVLRLSLSLVLAISFKKVSVVPVPAAALANPALAAATASPAGAAVTASAVRTVPNAATDKVTPRCLSKACNFPRARLTRIRAASSLLPKSWPTERKSRCSKKRSRMAVRSCCPSSVMASSRIGARVRQLASELSCSVFISTASRSRD